MQSTAAWAIWNRTWEYVRKLLPQQACPRKVWEPHAASTCFMRPHLKMTLGYVSHLQQQTKGSYIQKEKQALSTSSHSIFPPATIQLLQSQAAISILALFSGALKSFQPKMETAEHKELCMQPDIHAVTTFSSLEDLACKSRASRLRFPCTQCPSCQVSGCTNLGNTCLACLFTLCHNTDLSFEEQGLHSGLSSCGPRSL